MYNVHANYHTLIKTEGATRRVRLYKIPDSVNCTSDSQVTANGTLLKRTASDTNSNGLLSAVTLEDLFNKETDLTIGGSVSCLLTLALIDAGAASMLTAGRYKAYLDVLDGSTWRNCPLGVFLLEEPEKNGSFVRVSGFDQMQYFDRPVDREWWEGIFTQGTLKVQRTLNQIYSELVTQVSTEVGVTITPSNTDMLNKTVTYTAPFDPIEMTYRDILNWISEASGTVARFTRNGVLQLKWFTALDATYGIDADALGNGVFNIVLSEYSVAPIDKLQVRASDSDYGTILGTGENAYVITDNGFLSGTSDAQVRTRATPIYNRLIAFAAYTPISTSLIADPSIEAGDVITFTRGGVAYSLPIFQQTLTWRGGFVRGDIISTGSPKRPTLSAVNRYEFRTRQTVHELEVTAEELRSTITSVEDDLTNNYPTTATMRSEIEQTAQSITTSVSATYETKSDATSKLNTAKSYADGAITSALTAYPTTTEMNSAITQSATEISASVTQKISALEIGGTNFLLNSAFDDATTPFADHGLSKWNNNGSAQMVTLESGITCALMQIRQKDVTDGTQSVSQNFTARVINDTAGQIYTVSGDFVVNNLDEGSNPSLVFIFNGYYDDNGTETLMTPTYLSSSTASLRDMPNNQWVRRTYTLKFPNKLSRTNFLVYGREVNCNIYWKNLKIEHGDKATAWSPAPEDRPTFAEMSSAITIAADGITSTVSQTYETKSDASSKQSSLQSQITQNANAITTKVSETDFTGAEIASRINQSASTVEIEADHINLNGIVTTNSGFSIDSNGYMTANGATINGTVTSKSDDTTETATLGAGQLDVRTTSQQTTVSRSGVSIIDRDSGADSHTDITGGKIALSSLSPGSNYITLDPENGSSFDGAVTLNGSILTSFGDLSKTGTRLTFEPPGGAASILPSGSSYLSIGNITLEKGCWIIWASAQFTANANGIRGMALSAVANTSTPAAQWTQDRASGMSGAATFCKCMHLVNLSAQTTYYVNVMQNSGSNVNAYARIVAMRIA